ncbi:hypothetical protein HD806DRAFT_78835 [Xylariaceae sp. AK1471]|nr:hypothetical protein HD806DRAFT_78835 [Xylariaceae sp. AK1471]
MWRSGLLSWHSMMPYRRRSFQGNIHHRPKLDIRTSLALCKQLSSSRAGEYLSSFQPKEPRIRCCRLGVLRPAMSASPTPVAPGSLNIAKDRAWCDYNVASGCPAEHMNGRATSQSVVGKRAVDGYIMFEYRYSASISSETCIRSAIMINPIVKIAEQADFTILRSSHERC